MMKVVSFGQKKGSPKELFPPIKALFVFLAQKGAVVFDRRLGSKWGQTYANRVVFVKFEKKERTFRRCEKSLLGWFCFGCSSSGLVPELEQDSGDFESTKKDTLMGVFFTWLRGWDLNHTTSGL